MGSGYDTVTFLSDYGTADEFAGVVESVIADVAPAARVIHLTHQIPPHDVRAGSLALARAVQYLAEGIVLAVVDPGVGTERRAVAVEVAEGAGVFVGPDNGLLAPAVQMAGGAQRAVELTESRWHLEAPGATFAGRDVFAPVCGHLCTGVELAELGPAIDPAGLRPAVVPVARWEDDGLHAEVLWVDRFGNAQLNVGPEDIEALGDVLALHWDGQQRSAHTVATYGELGAGQVGLVVDGSGLVSVVLDRRSASAELGLSDGTPIRLVEAEGPERTVTPVELRR